MESASAREPVEGNVVHDLLMPLTGKSRARVPETDKAGAEVDAAAFVLDVFVDDEALVVVVLVVDDVFVDALVVEAEAAVVDALTTFMGAFEEVVAVATARAGQALRRTGRAEANARRQARKKR